MSMILSFSTPPGIEVKTHGHILGDRSSLHLRLPNCEQEVIIPLEDFRVIVNYVLTNSDLHQDDPRLKLLEDIKKMKRIPGYVTGGIRLGTVIDIPNKENN